MLSSNIAVNDRGHLTFAGLDTTALAAKYQTPLYLMDEDRIRDNCRRYKAAMAECFGAESRPLYAGKAACFKRIYEIMREENMAIDLVSPGEIHTAVRSGYPMENAFFHGNNKTDADIAYAMDCGVGYFVVDSLWELEAVEAEAERRGVRQKILLRLTPGIDPHTYAAVATGKVDSKFGVAIETGQAAAFVAAAMKAEHLDLTGYHCHVGSQVFDSEGTVYLDAAEILLRFADDMRRELGAAVQYINLGGGFGVRYTEDDPSVDIEGNIRAIAAHMKALCEKLGVSMPAVLMEPGRSIVADAGMTLYTVGAVKEIPGYKNYVSIDGGMTDNPRYALYGSKYTVHLANRMNEDCDFTADLAGRCCESGDIVQPNVRMPKPTRGDIVAVCTTGAYNYAMASNYNRIPRPPVVMLRGGEDRLAVRRESYEDLTKNDI